MKKIIFFTSVIGVAVGVSTFLINNKYKLNISKNHSIENKLEGVKPNISVQELESVPNVEEEIEDVKNSSIQSIYDRHVKADNIMHNAFENIYTEMEPVVQEEKKTESVISNSELDSLSDELDDLLK
ncbi:MAG: hypothetical protein M3Z34_08800 [Staphylococcus epidermidis]|nr:hypothetical protein [Staphylococcus epidermidis]